MKLKIINKPKLILKNVLNNGCGETLLKNTDYN